MLRNPIELNGARVLLLTACLSAALLVCPTPAHALDPTIANTQYGVSSWLSDDGLPQNWIGAIAQTPDGYLWFATEEGVSRFDGVRFTTFLEHRSIGAMLVARDGALWISDDRGLARYQDHKMTTYSTRDGLREGPINSMSEGSDGSIWMATRTGLSRYYQGKFSAYLVTDGSAPTWILSTTVTRDGSLWWGTNGGGLKRLHHGAVTAFTTSDGLADNIVLALREGRNGDLWIGTNNGLSRMHDGTITTIPKTGGLTNQCVKVIREDRDGNLWIGTDGGGLNRYTGGTFTSFGTQHKLSSTSVLSLLEDREGSLWVGTSGVGVTQLRPSKFTTIGRLEGLNADMVWSVREAIDVAMIDPNHIPFNTLAPPVWTEEVLVDGKVENVSPTGLAVGPGRHSLEIHYTALSFVMPKSVRFRYRLRGFSDQWLDAGNRRTAFYTNLPPGNYTFEVMGSNNDGVWSTAANPIQFRFQPAFFQRTSFRIACAVCLLLAVRAAFHIRLKLLHERERVLVKRVDEQTAELTAAKLAAESVAETNTRLRLKNELILNSIADGVYVVDLSGDISLENPAASRMLGWEKSSLVGRPAHATTHHSTLGGPYRIKDCPIYTTLRDGVLREVSDEVFWRKDGTSFPVHYLAAPILDSKGRVIGVAVTFRDVTELKAIEQLKNEFVSTVSHELRTPLTSIRGALGLLGSGLLGPIAEKGQRMLEIAVTNTDRLVRLINNILDLERMAAGKAQLTRAPVDAETILVQATEGLQSIAEEAEVRIVIKPATGAVWGDSDRIMQTLTNLLANAIKFSPRQTTVTVSGTAREKEFVFCVADEGRGVPEEKLATIFERFSQVDSSDSRDKGGSGLGLAICQSIVTAHGGRIWVEKNEPAGSRFQFTIPLANKDEQHAA